MRNLHDDSTFDGLRERLVAYEEMPSEGLWDKINAANTDTSPAWALWTERLSVVAAAALLIFGSFSDYSIVVNSELPVSDQSVMSNDTNTKLEIQQSNADRNLTSQEKNNFSRITRIARIEDNSISVQKAANKDEENLSRELTLSDSGHTAFIEDRSVLSVRSVSKITNIDSASMIPSSPTEIIPSKSKKQNRNRLQAYLMITPSLSFNKMIPTGDDQLVVQGVEHRSSMSMKRFGFGVDAGFQKDINRIVGVYGGLSFYRQNQEITYNYLDNQSNVQRIDDSWTFEVTPVQHSRTFDYTMTNVGARSGLLITLKGDKLQHKVGAGLGYQKGFAKSAGSYDNAQSNYIFYQVFYRNEFRVNENISWLIEPTFTYGFISKEKLDEPFRLKPYRVGISFGLLYRL